MKKICTSIDMLKVTSKSENSFFVWWTNKVNGGSISCAYQLYHKMINCKLLCLFDFVFFFFFLDKPSMPNSINLR